MSDNHNKESRPPTLNDLVDLCRRLNDAGARYMVVGGMAIIQQGFVRATEDVDLLIDALPENQDRVRQALMGLPDGAIKEMAPTDLDTYIVVRVADEFVVDLMKSACGIEFKEASKDIEWMAIQGVNIPFANSQLLWRMKQTVREKDSLDRLFLKEKLRAGRRP